MGILKTTAEYRGLASRLRPDTLTKKATLNAAASTIDYAARIGVEFVLNPLLVGGLGDFAYGLWRILWRMNGYMMAAGGRSAQALKWSIASMQTTEAEDEKKRTIGNAIVVWLLFLPVLMLLGATLTWFMPSWLDVPDEFVWPTRVATAILAFNVILLGLVDIPRAVLQGENLGYKRMGLSAATVVMGGGFAALAIYFELGLIGVASAAVATTLLTGALFLQVVIKHVSWFGIRKPSAKAVRWFLGLSGWFIVWKFVMQFMMAGDILILGIFDSVENVTMYSLTKYVPEALIRLVAIVVFGIAPGLGGLIGAGNRVRAAKVRGEIMLFTWLLITTTGATVLLWNQSFVTLWVGAEYDAGLLPTLLIVMMVAQLAFIRNDANIIDLTLNVRTKVLLGIVSVALSLGLAALLVDQFDNGIVGVCIGIIAGRLLLTIAYPWLVGRHLSLPISMQFGGTLRPLLTTTLIFAVALWWSSSLHTNSWLTLAGAAGTSVAFLGGTTMICGLSAGQRQRLFQRIRAVVGST